MEWISVKDRLPDNHICMSDCIFYLVFDTKPSIPQVDIARRYDDEWIFAWQHGYVGSVTHWMPLPEPPKE